MTKKAKRKTIAGLLIGGASLVGIAALVTAARRAEGLSDVYFEGRGFGVRSFSFRDGLALNIRLAVSNPSDVPLRIRNLFAQYFRKEGNYLLAETDYEQEWTIQPRQTTVLDIPVQVALASLGFLGSAALDALGQGKKFRIGEIQMRGKATINGLDYFIDETIYEL